MARSPAFKDDNLSKRTKLNRQSRISFNFDSFYYLPDNRELKSKNSLKTNGTLSHRTKSVLY